VVVTALIVCYFGHRRPLHTAGRRVVPQAAAEIERSGADRQGLHYVVDAQEALMLPACEMPPGPSRDLAFGMSRADDFGGDYGAPMEPVEAAAR
jgi:hypothetical protein